MKHLEIKNYFAGAGGGGPDDPPPPELKPPQLGDFSIASSYSYAETIDLISDGPILGLTNKNGYLLDQNSYLQGIYLNNIPVEETNDSFVRSDKTLAYSLTGNNPDFSCLNEAILDSFYKLSKYPDALYSLKSIDKGINTKTLLTSAFLGTDLSDSLGGFYDYYVFTTTKSQAESSLISIVHDDTPNSLSSADNLHNHACIDIGDTELNTELISGLTGQAVWYTNDIVYPTDYLLDENELPTNIIETTSVDYAREDFLNGENGFNVYAKEAGVPQISLEDLKERKICPRTVFWSKDCNSGFYTEMCLQISNFDKSLDQNQKEGIYRKKIDEAIIDIENLYSDPTTSRYTKEYIKERYKVLNGSLDTDEEGNTEPITKEKIKSLIQRTVTREVRLSSQLENWIFPYLFISYDKGLNEDNKIEGWHQDLERIYINEDVEINELVDGNAYSYFSGDVFYYNGKYYEVNYGAQEDANDQDENSAVPPEATFGTLEFTTDGLDIEKDIIDATTSNTLLNNVEKEDEAAILSEIILEDEKEIITNLAFDITSTKDLGYTSSTYLDFIIPIIDGSGVWDGRVRGFAIRMLDADNITSQKESKATKLKFKKKTKKSVQYQNILLDKNEIDTYLKTNNLDIYEFEKFQVGLQAPRKYNYTNILAEFREGGHNQSSLDYFKDIYIDHAYGSNLLGPFRLGGKGVQRLKGSSGKSPVQKINGTIPRLNFGRSRIPEMSDDFIFSKEEGSFDRRKSGKFRNYARWNKASQKYEEKALSVTHIIENPNVNSCFITLSIESLRDTAVRNFGGGSGKKVEFGSEMPAPLNIRVEVGLISENGEEEKSYDKFFRVLALIKTPALIDIGSPDNSGSIEGFRDIVELNPDADVNLLEEDTELDGGIYTPFELPNIERSDITVSDTSKKEDLKIKRYIKITKLSTETQSILITKKVKLSKVTEIIRTQCNYPLSAIVGTKVDSRSFTEMPSRTFRAKLKKVKIPSNYYPTFKDGKDKRYYDSKEDFENAQRQDKRIYKGDWDGTFKFEWTDNPAWILYDMLVSIRYGLGEQITEDNVNKWDLYKIGRFCDSVDSNGYFVGVSDGKGGLEPRFSCNIAFIEGTKIFDAINSISAIFRGIVFYQNSTITFSDDRIKKPIALFSNSNVENGVFSYSSYKRDEKFNAVEVAYKDRNDDYKTKIEYVENEKDIADRGLFKKEILAAGITSKAMAIRAARHLMYQTTKENETVAFTAGTEVLLCKPGDLVVIEDDLKTLRSNFGRVLHIDENEKTIRTSRIFKADQYENSITVYVPTGQQQKEDLDELANTIRERTTGFEIVAGDTPYANFDSNFTGFYSFSEYSNGYTGIGSIEDNTNGLYEQYAVYIGDNESKPIIWFNTGVTGWVWSTGGLAFKDDNQYDKFITQELGNEVFYFYDLTLPDTPGTDQGVVYDTNLSDRRSATSFSFKNKFTYDDVAVDLDYFDGVVEDEVDINGQPQIRNFNVTGWSSLSSSQKDYGDLIYINKNDINSNLLKFIPLGSTYRFQSKDASDQVYKIISINEKENISYEVVASKYNSGKFDEIENGIDFSEDGKTYGYTQQKFKINDTTYYKLDTPEPSLVTGENTNLETTDPERYYISGDWPIIDKATGYNVRILSPQGEEVDLGNENQNNLSYRSSFLGEYVLKVKALANNFVNEEVNIRYDDSSYGSDRVFVETAVDNSQDQSNVITIQGGGVT